MRQYNNILYVSFGISDETEGLKQAISTARNNNASLKVLVLVPEFPDDLPEYKAEFEKSILEKVKIAVARTKAELKTEENMVDTVIELVTDKTGAVDVIRHAIRGGHDLLVKEAEVNNTSSGFKAIDESLLRKCPVPLWICRPIGKSRDKINIAVAIDPESAEPAAEHLSLRLLQLANGLSKTCSQKFHIVSCWDYALESALKDSAFIRIPASEVDEKVEAMRQSHHHSLEKLVEEAGLDNNHVIHHLRGKPSDIIPAFVADNEIDILVMGTVARTGIAGFMIGNTAENIIQQLSCSLLALKPNGFVSPVKV